MFQRKHNPRDTTTGSTDSGAQGATQGKTGGIGNAEMLRRMSTMNDVGDFSSRPSAHHLGYKTSGWGSHRRDPEYTQGALFGADGQWSAQTILSNLTQLDADSETVMDNKRCAVVAMLAVHVMGGPSAVAKVAQDVMAQMTQQMNRGGRRQIAPDARNAMKAMYPSIEGLPQALMDKSATYAQLHRLADCIKLVIDKDLDSGTNGGEYKKLMRIGESDSRFLGRRQSGMAAADKLVQKLKESRTEGAYMLAVGTDDKKPDVTNHAITLGVNASGEVYIYDPWPKVGKQMLMWSTDYEQIRPYFETTSGQDRRWKVEVRIKDAQSSQSPAGISV